MAFEQSPWNGIASPTRLPRLGTATLLEVARAMGQLLKKGWRPRRSVVLCSWDGEEPGLLGSTAWTEAHAADLREKAVAYLNVDVGVSGPNWFLNAVPSLGRVARAVAHATPLRTGGLRLHPKIFEDSTSCENLPSPLGSVWVVIWWQSGYSNTHGSPRSGR